MGLVSRHQANQSAQRNRVDLVDQSAQSDHLDRADPGDQLDRADHCYRDNRAVPARSGTPRQIRRLVSIPRHILPGSQVLF